MSIISIKDRNRKLDLRKAPGTKARDFILMALFQAGKEGLSAKELEDKADVSRDTVYDECRKLKKEGLVDIKTVGKRTTYFAEPKIFNEVYLNSWFFGKEILSKIDSNLHVTTDRRQTTRNDSNNVEYYNTKFSEKDVTERFLFEFSVKVGAIITYIIIQAMNPATIKQLTYDNKLHERMVKDYMVERWVKNVISPVKILCSLRRSIDEPGYHVKFDDTKKFANTSSYELSSKTIQELSNAFNRLYPNVYDELEDIKKNLPHTLDIMRKHIEQGRCSHEFHTSRLKSDKQFECPKCKIKMIVPLSKIETDKAVIEKLNKLKPPSETKCSKNNNHCWTRDLSYDMTYRSIVYQCPLCKEALRLYTEDKKILDKIEDAVQRELGSRYTTLCYDIQLYFYHHRNEVVKIKELLKFYEDRKMTKISNPEDFVYDISGILDIMVKNGYIGEIDSSPTDLLNRACIRTKPYNIVWP